MPEKKVKTLFFTAKSLKKLGYAKLANQLNYKIQKNYGCYISLNAHIDKTVEFRHPIGIVIGDGVCIKRNVIIYQGVTLGGRNIGDYENNNYPTICENTILYAGSKVLGNICVGSNVIIGANAVVIKDVKPNSKVVGVPAYEL